MRTPRIAATAAAMGLAFASSSALAAARACPEVGFVVAEAAGAPDTRVIRDPRGAPLSVRRQAVTTTADIVEVRVEAQYRGAALQLRFTPEGAARLTAATTNFDGGRLAFVEGDRAVMVVTWTGPYGFDPGGAQVSMSDGALARRLAAELRRCLAP
jgi:hypothetical protein